MSNEEFVSFLTAFLKEKLKTASLDKSIDFLSFDSENPLDFPDEDLFFELIPHIGSYKQEKRKLLEKEIHSFMENNPGMAVAGRYSLQNYISRPSALFLLIKQKKSKEGGSSLIGLLNFTIKSQIIPLISSELFNAQKTKDIILQLIEKLADYFIFAAGDEFITSLSKIYNQDIQMHNNVYQFRDTQKMESYLAKATLDGQYTMYLFDTLSIKNLNILAKLPLLNDFYHYEMSEEKIIQKINQSPHMLILLNNQPIAGCRANANCEEFAIIGGVSTHREYRRKGLGKYMCAQFVSYLLQHVKDVFLDTDEKNVPARKIYESIGFVPIGNCLFIDHGSGVVKGILAERDY